MNKEMVKVVEALTKATLAQTEAVKALTVALGTETTTAEEAAPEKETKAKTGKGNKAAKEAEETEAGDYTGMKADELFALCKERGIKCKAKAGKAKYIELLEAADAEGEEEEIPKTTKGGKGKTKKDVKKVEEENDDEEEWDEEDEVDYSKMTAKELYEECKGRGIEAETRKKADYYIELLKADDASETTTEEDDEDEDWDI